MIELLNDEVREDLARTAEMCDTFEEFSAYAGWDDWMDQYLEDIGHPAQDEPDEQQLRAIERVLKEVWEAKYDVYSAISISSDYMVRDPDGEWSCYAGEVIRGDDLVRIAHDFHVSAKEITDNFVEIEGE